MLLGVCRPGNARTDRAAPIAGRPALNGSTTEAQEDERFEVTERIAIFRPRRKSAADMLLEQYTAFGDRTQVIADGSRKAPEQPCDLVLGQPYTAISELGFHLPVADGFFGNFDLQHENLSNIFELPGKDRKFRFDTILFFCSKTESTLSPINLDIRSIDTRGHRRQCRQRHFSPS